jgi:hypothetical protein
MIGESIMTGFERLFKDEPTAEEILNGTYVRKPSPKIDFDYIEEGFAKERITKVPEPGIHPRILFSPEDIPGLKRRLQETETGRFFMEELYGRLERTVENKESWQSDVLKKLETGDYEEAYSLLHSKKWFSYRPDVLYPLMLKSFDCLVFDKLEEGRKVAGWVNGFALMLETRIDEILKAPCADNASRSGSWHALGSYEIFGFQYLGYCYDFIYNYMSDEQRNNVRRVISKSTYGRIMHGMDLPAHFRYWNWMSCGTCFILLALAIEGEEGYDERIYSRGIELMRDYITYGYSKKGSSTEAVGYTAFGWVWGIETMIAMARRGDNLFFHSHFNEIKNWHLNTMQPWGKEWLSRGDGGNGGPGIHFMQAMKYFYPEDKVIDYLWHNTSRGWGKEAGMEDLYILSPLLCAEDGLKDEMGRDLEYKNGAVFNKPNTFYDEERGALITRSNWSKDSVVMQFECRIDTVSPSHEHSDRGSFTLAALGKEWAVDIASTQHGKYHNCVLIDGKGQGFFAPPGQWLGTFDTPEATFGVCDSKNAYDWFWPKTIVATTELDDPRLKLERFRGAKFGKNLITEIESFKSIYKGYKIEKDTSPAVVKFYDGYLKGDPRIWDEDTWPVRLEYNPVKKAFRTAGLIRGRHNYSIIIDDIQKDEKEHLYEWIMMVPNDVELLEMKNNDFILGFKEESDADSPRLLVRILNSALPSKPEDYSTKPDVRLESFGIEKISAFGEISYIKAKRMVIGSRSIAPEFKVLLFPFRKGEELPQTVWNNERDKCSMNWKDQVDELEFIMGYDGRTFVSLCRDKINILETKKERMK